MKFHWGHGIALFYSLFALTLVVVVIKSTGFDNSLVFDDYYAQDIRYQQTINKRHNSAALKQPVLLQEEADQYYLIFPVQELSAKISGELQLYRPSSSNYDRFIELSIDVEGRMLLPTEALIGGFWKVIINWTSAGVDYLDEFEIYHSA